MVGYPDETEKDFKETKEFLRRNSRFVTMIRSINPLYIMAGSEIFCNPQKYNIVLPHKNSDREWYIENENTYSIRENKVLELKKLAESLKISFTEEAESLEFTVDYLSKKIKTDRKDKAKILLVMCPMWDVSLPPLGSAYLASYLESKGIQADILDINIELYTNSDSSRKNLWKMENYNLWSWRPEFEMIEQNFKRELDIYVERIVAGGYSIVGFSIYGANILFSILFAKILKRRRPDIFIVFGGSSCSFLCDHPDMPVSSMICFKTGEVMVEPGLIDAFVVGEGEEKFYRLIKAYFSKALSPIDGVILFINGKYSSFTPGTLIDNLDTLPYPSWDKLPLELYTCKSGLPILLSRGCVNRCTFCNDWRLWDKKYRVRSPENIFGEMKRFFEKYKVSDFNCNDLLINGNLKMLEELASIIIKERLPVRWYGQGSIRIDMNLQLLKKIRQAGFSAITYGVESLSENVLKSMGKPFTFPDVVHVLKETKNARIAASVNFVVGFPTETKEDFLLTKKRLVQIKGYVDEISSLSPCHITGNSILQENAQDFSVDDAEKGLNYYWNSLRGENTYEVRKERAKELAHKAKELGFKVSFVGIYDEIALPKEDKKDYLLLDSQKTYDFILVSLPPWSQDNPHIGIGYLSSYLGKKGMNFKVLDLNKSFFINNPDFRMLWHVENKNFWSNEHTFPLILEIFNAEIEEAIEEISTYDCDFLGFSVVDPKERLTIEFIKRIKERAPNKKIILGGPATSTHEQRKIFLDNLDSSIDAFVVGEGEETLSDLVDSFLNKKDILEVLGCYVRNNGKWTHKERACIAPLDKVPFPSYEEFGLDLYGKSLLVEWSRGCKGKCSFCKNYRLFPGYRSKSSDWIINELRYHKEKNNIHEFTVVDNILNGDLNNLNEVCNRLIKENLGIRWSGQIAPHKNMDLEFFKTMRKAGCFKLQIGLESGSNKVLKLMKKTFTSEISEKNIRLAKKAGIETEIFVMIGFPGECDKDFKKTYDFIKRNSSHIDCIKSINTLHLIAGTEVYENTEKYNIRSLPDKDWHYLWETDDGNNYIIRKKRAERLLNLANDLGLKVMETNIEEGRESNLVAIANGKTLEERISLLKKSINSLQKLPQGRKALKSNRRNILKWLILIFVSLFTFFYIVYFWVFMSLRNRVLLGGKKS